MDSLLERIRDAKVMADQDVLESDDMFNLLDHVEQHLMAEAEARQAAAESDRKARLQTAIGVLSYSEREAAERIFQELSGKTGMVTASRIADEAGLTRSVLVNTLRMFESAGVIESRSLGMKGTHIRILLDLDGAEIAKALKDAA